MRSCLSLSFSRGAACPIPRGGSISRTLMRLTMSSGCILGLLLPLESQKGERAVVVERPTDILPLHPQLPSPRRRKLEAPLGGICGTLHFSERVVGCSWYTSARVGRDKAPLFS